jgi:aspartate racemase
VDKLLDECRAQYGARDDRDYPPLLIHSLGRGMPEGQVDLGALGREVTQGLARLEAAGAAFVALTGSTAHVSPAQVPRPRVPVLDPAEEVRRALPRSARSVAILATRPTLETRHYQERWARTGLEVRHDPRWQPLVERLRRAVNEGSGERHARLIWRRLLRSVRSVPADAIVLCDPELNVGGASAVGALPIVDATRCLAAAAVLRWREILGPRLGRRARESA